MGKPVIVCLHGLGRSPDDWSAVTPSLRRYGRVITPALPRDVARAQQVAADVTPDGAILVGHSMGAIIALSMAAERPDAIEAVAASSPFFPPARNGRSLPATVAGYLGHRVAFVRELRPRHRPVDSRSGGVRGLGFLIRTALRREAFRAKLDAVACRVLVLHSVDDHYVPLDFVLAEVNSRPDWEMRILQSGGHYPHVQAPAQWLAVLEPWLTRLRPAPDA